MYKKIAMRLASGFSTTTIIVMILQFVMAQNGSPIVTADFAAHFANDSAAMILQLFFAGLIGMSFAGAALFFEIERWSFLKQGVIHFLTTAAVWLPISIVCWAPTDRLGWWFTICGWTVTYLINWLIRYFISRRCVKELNDKIRSFRRAEDQIERN